MPFVIQFVLGALILSAQLVGKAATDHTTHRGILQGALLITVVVGSMITAGLLASRSPSLNGLALSVAASTAIVIPGGIFYASWLGR